MRSSTSSFKYAFACCIAILLVHTFSLRFINFKIETGQSQFQENKIKMENFIFSPQTCSSAIVGSSLSYRLKNEDLGNEFCNLAFAGGSALTGLEILDSHLPENLKEVFVEMNVLRPVDRELLNSVQGPSYWLKYTLPFFQNRFQPVTLLINYLLRKSQKKQCHQWYLNEFTEIIIY